MDNHLDDTEFEQAMFDSMYNATERLRDPNAGLDLSFLRPSFDVEHFSEPSRLRTQANSEYRLSKLQFGDFLDAVYGERRTDDQTWRDRGVYVRPEGVPDDRLDMADPRGKRGIIDPNTGEHPDVLYRYEGPGGMENLKKTGELTSHFGGADVGNRYTHASLFPDPTYADRDTRLLRIRANQEQSWKYKGNGAGDAYGVATGPIRAEDVEDITGSYEGPWHGDRSQWEHLDIEPGWATLDTTDKYTASKGDIARELADWKDHGLITPEQAHEYRKRL